ncbi:pyridoxal 5'-phosphate synthase (glutamine hydrolyzing) [Malassezia cuniculi]|uniref:glutaminase n=1 Tax=Malassezia cuniculi TaxID=948313 RepID=A0AAF0J589_9BASI|nr:pyridoxal 5'-phosphate synthase (glutamine hydrolyzing) [Malassezia cuniculi]
MSSEQTVTVGVLALQGAFHEHIQRFMSLNALSATPSVRALAVRRPEQLEQCDALVIPGGESTAIALGMRRGDLVEPVHAWIASGRPIWGTCAGMILLARVATGGKRGGQELLGGVDIQVGRNGFGSQVNSFEAGVTFPALGAEPFTGVFIRAPVVDALLPDAGTVSVPQEGGINVSSANDSQDGTRPPLEILGWIDEDAMPSAPAGAAAPVWTANHSRPATPVLGPRPALDAQIVAVRQGNALVTSFHPELTGDTRLHAYFVNMALETM